MKRFFCLLAVSLLFGGCASLSKTQLESVNQLALTTKSFSAYPSRLMSELADIRFRRGAYFASTLSDPKLHLGLLDSIYNQKVFDAGASARMELTMKILDRYAQSLLLLSSDKYQKDLIPQAKSFGVSLDSLVALNNRIDGSVTLPVGLGGAVGKLVLLGGKQYSTIKQAREVVRFMAKADTIVATMTSHLERQLRSAEMNDLIAAEERALRSSYLSYLRQSAHVSIENDRDYLALKASIDGVKQLQARTIAAACDYRAAHKRVLAELRKRKPLKVVAKELQVLVEDMNDLRVTIQKLDFSKKK